MRALLFHIDTILDIIPQIQFLKNQNRKSWIFIESWKMVDNWAFLDMYSNIHMVAQSTSIIHQLKL